MNSLAQIAVDIGNSGARLVRLPAEPNSALPPPIRINWRKHPLSTETSLSLYTTEQSDWQKRLSPIIQETLDQSQNLEWWISSVHRAACESLVEYLNQFSHCKIQVVDYKSLPLVVDVDYPEKVGIDRLLAAYAASRCVQAGPFLVIQAGSAVTVDLVQEACDSPGSSRIVGRFSGGAILPGVPMMLRLLSNAADMLPEVAAAELIELPPIPGRNSQAAMWAGVSSCLVGGVLHLVQRYREEFGISIPIVLSGGDGPLLRPHLIQPFIEVDHLVLQGLRLLAQS